MACDFVTLILWSAGWHLHIRLFRLLPTPSLRTGMHIPHLSADHNEVIPFQVCSIVGVKPHQVTSSWNFWDTLPYPRSHGQICSIMDHLICRISNLQRPPLPVSDMRAAAHPMSEERLAHSRVCVSLLMLRVLPCSSSAPMSCSWQTRREQCTAAGVTQRKAQAGCCGADELLPKFPWEVQQLSFIQGQCHTHLCSQAGLEQQWGYRLCQEQPEVDSHLTFWSREQQCSH